MDYDFYFTFNTFIFMFFYFYGGYSIIKTGLRISEYLSMPVEKSKKREKSSPHNTRKAINIIFVFSTIALLYYALFSSSFFPVFCVMLGILGSLLSIPKLIEYIKKSNISPIGKGIVLITIIATLLLMCGYLIYWIYGVAVLGR